MIEAIYRMKMRENAGATHMHTEVAIAKYLHGKTGVFSSGWRKHAIKELLWNAILALPTARNYITRISVGYIMSTKLILNSKYG